MIKSTSPYNGPPSWLDPNAELPLDKSPRFLDRVVFVHACMTALLALGCDVYQAASVTANACNEAGWGPSCWYGNAGGWKITKAYADAYKARERKPAPFWKARGNVNSGDADWCFYRAFPSLQDFLREWLEHFVPRPGATAPYSGYTRTGELFWSGGEWFPALVMVGYKGAVTKARLVEIRRAGRTDSEHGSTREHAMLSASVLILWAQGQLGVTADGAWGAKSRAACVAWQVTKSLPPTGGLDAATLASLA